VDQHPKTESPWLPDLVDYVMVAVGSFIPVVLPLAALIYVLRRTWGRVAMRYLPAPPADEALPTQGRQGKQRQSPASAATPAPRKQEQAPAATPVPRKQKQPPAATPAPRTPPSAPIAARPEQAETLRPLVVPGIQGSGSVPHLLIVGPSGIGKTTLLHAMAREWHQQHDEVIVLDLDAPRGVYPYRVIGSGGDGERVGSAFAALHRLLEKRENARFRGERVAPPVRLLVNDVHEIAQVHPEAWNDLVGRILRRGHKLDVLLAVVTYASKVSEVVPAPRDDLAEMQRIELAWEGEQRVARLNGQIYRLPML
jgi:hypothetical protein